MLIAPHIKTPLESEQFNTGRIDITWERPAAIDFIDYENQEIWRYDYNTDVNDSAWSDIQTALDDAAGENAYGGKQFVIDMFFDPISAASSPSLLDGYSESIVLDSITVTLISSIADTSFSFNVVNNSTSELYRIETNLEKDIIIYLITGSSMLDNKQLVYELEYCDNYSSDNATWSAIKKRLPWNSTSYTWSTGKMIKSKNVRVRMRTKYMVTEQVSDWSISNLFSINVFKLLAPIIINPVPNALYSDFLIIILDDSQIINTFNQKVRYTLEYSSLKQEVGWTVIAKDMPVGQTIYRWNLDGIASSDDYILRVTAKNSSTSCEATVDNPDQIARSFVHNISIQQSGMFIIDTVPPEAVLQIGQTGRVTNQLNQVLTIFAEDATTDIKQIQLRECDVGESLLLGELSEAVVVVAEDSNGEPGGGDITTAQCPSPSELLAGGRTLDKLITDAPLGNMAKVQWVFDELDSNGDPVSAVKKIEALLTDMGGNTSLQEKTKIFLPVFTNDNTINDFIIVVEQREKLTFDGAALDRDAAIYEVVYVGTDSGEFWVIEPYSRYLYSLTNHPSILKLFEFNEAIYLFSYNSTTDRGAVYRHDGTVGTLLKEFSSGLGIVTGMNQFNNSLFIGLENGDLWEYNGFSFVLVRTFDEPINTLFGDNKYLYIGFQNSTVIFLYNGTYFTELSL